MPKGTLRIQYIEDKKKRFSAFSKRKSGLMTKAKELQSLTGARFMIICETPSETKYSFNSDVGMEMLRNSVQNYFSDKATPLDVNKKLSQKRQKVNNTEIGPMEFRKLFFEKEQVHELTWFVSGSGLRRKDFMKEQNIVSNQEKGKLSYILNT